MASSNNEALRTQIEDMSREGVMKRMKAILSLFRSHSPRSARSEEERFRSGIDQRLLGSLLESEIDLGLFFASEARAAYQTGAFGRAETAHAKVEQSYARVVRLAAEVDSADRESLRERLGQLREELSALRVRRDESACQP